MYLLVHSPNTQFLVPESRERWSGPPALTEPSLFRERWLRDQELQFTVINTTVGSWKLEKMRRLVFWVQLRQPPVRPTEAQHAAGGSGCRHQHSRSARGLEFWICHFEFSTEIFPHRNSLLKADSVTKCFKISYFFFLFFKCLLWNDSLCPLGYSKWLCTVHFVPEAAYLLVLWLVHKSPNYKVLEPPMN